jgi:hypothetical protein
MSVVVVMRFSGCQGWLGIVVYGVGGVLKLGMIVA